MYLCVNGHFLRSVYPHSKRLWGVLRRDLGPIEGTFEQHSTPEGTDPCKTEQRITIVVNVSGDFEQQVGWDVVPRGRLFDDDLWYDDLGGNVPWRSTGVPRSRVISSTHAF